MRNIHGNHAIAIFWKRGVNRRAVGVTIIALMHRVGLSMPRFFVRDFALSASILMSARPVEAAFTIADARHGTSFGPGALPPTDVMWTVILIAVLCSVAHTVRRYVEQNTLQMDLVANGSDVSCGEPHLSHVTSVDALADEHEPSGGDHDVFETSYDDLQQALRATIQLGNAQKSLEYLDGLNAAYRTLAYRLEQTQDMTWSKDAEDGEVCCLTSVLERLEPKLSDTFSLEWSVPSNLPWISAPIAKVEDALWALLEEIRRESGCTSPRFVLTGRTMSKNHGIEIQVRHPLGIIRPPTCNLAVSEALVAAWGGHLDFDQHQKYYRLTVPAVSAEVRNGQSGGSDTRVA